VNVTVSGSPYVQQWQIPSRAACLACHTPQAGHALSFNTRQLNLTNIINSFAGNQISVLHAGGCFANPPESPNLLPRHLRPDETTYPVEARVRSYLAVNCAYCHKAGGTGAPAMWDGRPELTLDQTGLINGVAANNGGNPANKLVVPGDTVHSIVLNRVAVTNGFTRMPPLGSNELDQTNIALLTDWIAAQLPNRQTYDQWRLDKFGSPSSPEGEPNEDADGDSRTNRDEFLAGSLPLDGGSFLNAQPVVGTSSVTLTFQLPANRSFQVEQSTNLSTWTLWDIPGNGGLPVAGGAVSITGPVAGSECFFRLRIREN
jgi:mono/diheme cytochrome c family protein